MASTYGVEDEVIRSACTLHSEDDDFGQPGTLVRKVMDDAQCERLVGNVSGHLLNDVSEPVLERAFQYWRNVDKETGDKIEQTRPHGRGEAVRQVAPSDTDVARQHGAAGARLRLPGEDGPQFR